MSAPGQEQPVEGAPATTEAPSTPAGPDLAPFMDRMNELANTVDTRFASLEERFPQPTPEPEPDPWASIFGTDEPEAETDPYGNPVQAQPQPPQMDLQALQAATNHAIQQANAPLVAELQQMKANAAREQLFKDIPQLRDPAVQTETFNKMIEAYRAAGESDENTQRALGSAFLISQFFKAAEAEKLAQGQAPAGGNVPSLEAAGGALPGGNGEPINPVDQAYAGRPPGIAKGFL